MTHRCNPRKVSITYTQPWFETGSYGSTSFGSYIGIGSKLAPAVPQLGLFTLSVRGIIQHRNFCKTCSTPCLEEGYLDAVTTAVATIDIPRTNGTCNPTSEILINGHKFPTVLMAQTMHIHDTALVSHK